MWHLSVYVMEVLALEVFDNDSCYPENNIVRFSVASIIFTILNSDAYSLVSNRRD